MDLEALDALAEQGTRVDSLNILADIPRFVASSITILESLDPARCATVMLPFGIFAVRDALRRRAARASDSRSRARARR